MKKIILLTAFIFILLMTGCGSSNKTTDINRVFLVGTSETGLFPTSGGKWEIIDTNETYQTYISDINKSVSEGERHIISELSQNIDFKNNRMLIIKLGGFAGYDDDIYNLSKSIIKIDFESKYLEIVPQVAYYHIFGYSIDREIKSVQYKVFSNKKYSNKFSKDYKIDLNNAAY